MVTTEIKVAMLLITTANHVGPWFSRVKSMQIAQNNSVIRYAVLLSFFFIVVSIVEFYLCSLLPFSSLIFLLFSWEKKKMSDEKGFNYLVDAYCYSIFAFVSIYPCISAEHKACLDALNQVEGEH